MKRDDKSVACSLRNISLVLVSSVVAFGCSTLQGNKIAQVEAKGSRASLGCDVLQSGLAYPGMKILSVQQVAKGEVTRPGITDVIPEHCVVRGKLNERLSVVDGQVYAIGFEMRLPTDWNGRFFYQANGGLDGVIAPAFGEILGGGPRSNALTKGFAVISSDAGHAMDTKTPIGGGLFGLDPQARLDYGYNAVAQLTPMAKSVIKSFYGRNPDKSYIVGTSNGGRHAMMAAARDTGLYDGVLATAPGFNLPRAAVTQLWDAQQFAKVAPRNSQTGRPDLEGSFAPADLSLVAKKVLEKCDALDGLKDGVVSDPIACRQVFDVVRDVPACNKPDGVCLTPGQKETLSRVYQGPMTQDGKTFYVGKAWDPGIAGKDWRTWKFTNSVGPRDAVSVAFVFSTPPQSLATLTGAGTTLLDFALGFDLDRDGPKIFAKDETYRQSAVEFMIPPDISGMSHFISRGGKIIVAHGSSDPVFSAMDTVKWYQDFAARHGSDSRNSARLYLVPGMNHSRNGPATDQFDMVDALVAWVEQGKAPQAIVATARGPKSNLPNPEVPADWASDRSRLLCPFPSVARYVGGSTEKAESFLCQNP